MNRSVINGPAPPPLTFDEIKRDFFAEVTDIQRKLNLIPFTQHHRSNSDELIEIKGNIIVLLRDLNSMNEEVPVTISNVITDIYITVANYKSLSFLNIFPMSAPFIFSNPKINFVTYIFDVFKTFLNNLKGININISIKNDIDEVLDMIEFYQNKEKQRQIERDRQIEREIERGIRIRGGQRKSRRQRKFRKSRQSRHR
jgi:hypothetical protein